MPEPVKARSVEMTVEFNGADITKDIRPYLLSAVYTDCEDDDADDLQLTLQDRAEIWASKWLGEALSKTLSGGLKIKAAIRRLDASPGAAPMVLPCGTFELTEFEFSGPPRTITLSATAFGFSSGARDALRSKAWKNIRLSAIAGEIAGRAGLALRFDAPGDPFYKSRQQKKKSDASFLSGLCKDAGLSLKATGKELVIFDQSVYEAKPPVMTIRNGPDIIKFTCRAGAAGTGYDRCRVRWTRPDTGEVIEGVATAPGFNGADGEGRTLEITAAAQTAAGANALAAKKLKAHNRFANTASVTMPGNVFLAAGQTVMLDGFGVFSGKYFIYKAKHSLGGKGYQTELELCAVGG